MSDRTGTEGDFKLYGRAREVHDQPVLRRCRAALRARSDREPPGGFHLFDIEIESAGFVVFGDDAYGMAWDPEAGTRRWSQRLE